MVPNVAVYCGHSSVRTYVLGHGAAERQASESEVAEMAEIVREAMTAGAVGLSSTTNPQHNGEHGVPMVSPYVLPHSPTSQHQLPTRNFCS